VSSILSSSYYALIRRTVPPIELQQCLFFFVEQQERLLADRIITHGHVGNDYSLTNLFALLKEGPKILLQDTAIIRRDLPDAAFLQVPPFNDPAFHRWADEAVAGAAAVEKQLAIDCVNLPANLLTGVTTLLASQSAVISADMQGLKGEVAGLTASFDALRMQLAAGSSGTRVTATGAAGSAPATSASGSSQIDAAVIVVSTGTPTFILGKESDYADRVMDKRFDEMRALSTRLGDRIANVTFSWRPVTSIAKTGWVPVVPLEPTASLQIRDVYTQWTDGHVGGLSTHALEKEWGTRCVSRGSSKRAMQSDTARTRV
jgi:hypothetical protein